MADEVDDSTSDRFGGLPALAVRLGAVLRFSGRLGVEVPSPLGSADRRLPRRGDAPNQLGQRCSGSYLQGAVFDSVEAGE
jgi:hypothetical protein